MRRIYGTTLLFFAFLFFVCNSAYAQFTVNAGSDKVVCPGLSVLIGGSPTASGGQAPYTYSWSPSAFLSSTSSPNPTCTPTAYVTYTLTVTDDTGAVRTDQVIVSLTYLSNVDAGNDTSICVSSYALLGGDMNVAGAGVSYSWAPTTFLDNNTLPRPTCTNPTSSITYTLTASYAGCAPKTDYVTVNLIPVPNVDAGPDITIQEGQTATLQGSGGFSYAWSPASTITYQYSANPNAEPIVTTTYTLYGTDPTKKCSATDTMTVFVIPNDEVVFYNTFTPNGDQNNDTWYIGNIYKYPNNVLEIYNRNGKVVFRANGYQNNWDGKAFGEDLPAGTYFYVMDLGDGKGNRHGTVTIIK